MSARSIVALATTLAMLLPATAVAAPATRGTGAPKPPAAPPSTATPKDTDKDDGGGRGGGSARGAAPAEDDDGGELSGDEGGTGGHNTCRKQPRGAKFRITLPKEAELDDLVNWMMSVSCQKFIWDPKVRGGKVTILSPEAVTVEEAYAAFYASLQTMGLTVEPSGDYFKIVETADAKGRTLPVYGPGGRAPNNDRYVTQLYRVEGGNTADIVTLLDKLKTKQGSVDQIGDLVILTDTGSSVRRLLKIVQQLDNPEVTAEKIFFFQLRYADPETIAETIREIFGEKGGTGKAAAKPATGRAKPAAPAAGAATEPGFSRVIVDERTGTLIIVAQDSDYQVIRKLIEQLDVPLSGGAGRIHVVKLRNADPEEVANVLTQLGSSAQGRNRQGGGAQGRQGQQGAAQPAQPTPGAQPGESFSGDIRVTADPATRSLVILASQSDFVALEEVIKALDAERKQVYIEVYLLELNVEKTIEAGVGAHFGAGFNVNAPGTSGQGVGFVANAPTGKANSLLLSPSVLPGLAAGVLGPQIPGSGALTGLGQDIPAFGVIIQALQQDSDVNFVAEPHLYTADNQEAAIEVGRNVPTPGAVSFNPGGGAGGGLTPFQSIQRQDVSLNVKVTPHVNDERTVTLDIEMENNEIAGEHPTLGVTTTKRRLKLDKVVARDDQPVVLGGLVQEVERESVSQVPGLGQVPLLGWLFKGKRRTRTKVNLLMILVPHILETPDDARRIHKRRLDERMEFLERYTAFKRRDLDTNVNYRKKSGLLASINSEASRMTDQQVARERAELEMQRTEITGEIGLSPKSFSDDEDEEPVDAPPSAPARPSTPAAPSTPPAPRKPGAQVP
jgi:general secretion pathway protein D